MLGWPGPPTWRQHLVWLAWLKWKYDGFKGDLSLDGVPKEVRVRWERQVGAAAYSMAAATERKTRAHAIASETGRDVSEVYDELKATGR